MTTPTREEIKDAIKWALKDYDKDTILDMQIRESGEGWGNECSALNDADPVVVARILYTDFPDEEVESSSKMRLTKQDDQRIAKAFPGGDHEFFHQVLDEENELDAKQWIDEGHLVGLVSEIHGGIIGYIHEEHADDIATVLNLHVIERMPAK